MLELRLQSEKGNSGKAEMFISAEQNSIDITILSADEKQFDFTITGDEWEQIKSFVDKTK